MAGILTVDTIQSDSSYASTLNVASKVNFTSGMQVGGQDATFGGMRNLVINGDMRIAQRNTSATGVGVDGSSFPTVDRAKFFSIGSATARWTCTQSTDAPAGFNNSIKFECTTAAASPNADARHQIGYIFEGLNLQQLKYGTADAKPITVSFWIKASRTGTQTVFFYQYAAFSGTGGYISRQVTINSANTWEYKTVTIAGNTATALANDNTAQLGMNIPLYLGTTYAGGTFQDNTWKIWDAAGYAGMGTNQVNHASAVGNIVVITGVQMEIGSSATAFEYRQFQQELALCQRYYYKIKSGGTSYSGLGVGYNGNTTNAYNITNFPVTMRTRPTALETSGTATDYAIAYEITATACNSVPTYSSPTNEFQGISNFFIASGLTTGQGSRGCSNLNNANAFLAWSAEL